MIEKFLITTMFIIISQMVFAQNKLPIIKADSIKVAIRDGKNYNASAWYISPKIKPDIYKTSDKSVHRITFYTNRDSISFIVKPNEKYDFIILFGNKDSAYTQILYEPTYLETLKHGSQYNQKDNREIPNYYYKSPKDSFLISLKNKFNLDSIAGTGEDVLKVLNVLHWLHNYIPHDGEHEEPFAKNNIELMIKCKKDGRGLCCGTLSEILNDCYLSIGFISRRVVCLPKDSLKIDPDCHSINVVFVPTLKKWIWIDPTHNAYIMDEHGNLLNIEEVRERLILDKPVILNPDANWCNKAQTKKDYYLNEYMAKNLYKIRCYIESQEKDLQGKTKFTAIELIPLDYYIQKPDKYTDERSGKIVIYRTNNSSKFWQIP